MRRDSSEPLEGCESQLWLLVHPKARHLRRIAAVYQHLGENIHLRSIPRQEPIDGTEARPWAHISQHRQKQYMTTPSPEAYERLLDAFAIHVGLDS